MSGDDDFEDPAPAGGEPQQRKSTATTATKKKKKKAAAEAEDGGELEEFSTSTPPAAADDDDGAAGAAAGADADGEADDGGGGAAEATSKPKKKKKKKSSAAAAAAADDDAPVDGRERSETVVRQAENAGHPRSWDWVLVCPNIDQDAAEACCGGICSKMMLAQVDKRGKIVRNLRMAGLTVKKQLSRDGDEIFVKVSTPYEKLLDTAEHVSLRLPLNEEHGGGYGSFVRDKMALFEAYDEESGRFEFTSAERQLLTMYNIRGKKQDGGAEVDIDRLVLEREVVLQAFPMHEPDKRRALMDTWAKKWFKPQPFEDIKAYFGEEVSLYFAWLGFYTKALIWVTIPGLIAFIYSLFAGIDNILVPVYCIILVIWATLYCEMWKRKEKVLAYQWGVRGYEEEEPIRPEYSGEVRYGFYSNDGVFVSLEAQAEEDPDNAHLLPQSIYFSRKERIKRYLKGWPLILIFAAIVVVITIGIMTSRLVLQRKTQSAFIGGLIAGVILAIVILVLDWVYKFVAYFLNEYENHRTETAARDALIVKSFVFQFVNNYVSLFYVAFVKLVGVDLFGGERDKCEGDECLTELTSALMSLLITRQVIGQINELFIPWLWNKMTVAYENTKMKAMGMTPTPMTAVEAESKLFTYQDTFDDYNEMAIQFGYVTLFAAAFPLASALALLNNVVEIRADAFKLLSNTSRPRKTVVEDIGMWQQIFELLSMVAVVTNVGIIAFTSVQLERLDWSPLKILAVAVIAEHLLLGFKFLLAALIPDEPGWLLKAAARAEFEREQAFGEAPPTPKPEWESESGPDSENFEVDSEIEAEDAAAMATEKQKKKDAAAAKKKKKADKEQAKAEAKAQV